MDKQCRALCEKLAGCIVKRDFNGAHALLAPWLRSALTPAAIEKMVDAANEGLAHPPKTWTIDEGMAELEELREPDPYGPPTQKISSQITDKNFRGWLNIQFEPDESVHDEQNVCCAVWLVAVEHDGAVLAGYLEAAEAS
jgi:hypothetical protein